MALFIQWQEHGKEFVKQEYYGGGITINVMKDIKITRKSRWSNDESPEMKAKAKQYIRESFPASDETRFNVKLVTLDE